MSEQMTKVEVGVVAIIVVLFAVLIGVAVRGCDGQSSKARTVLTGKHTPAAIRADLNFLEDRVDKLEKKLNQLQGQ